MATEGLEDWVQVAESPIGLSLNPEIMNYDRFPPYHSVDRSRSYVIETRGIDPVVASRFDLRFDPRQVRIVCPVSTKCGSLLGGVGRLLPDLEGQRYWNYFGFTSGKSLGGLRQLKGFPRVIVVEGFFDMVRVAPWAWELEYDVVCTWHAEAGEHQISQLLGLDATLFCGYDNDTAGNLGWEKLKATLKPKAAFGLIRVVPPEGVDCGAMSKALFTQLVLDRTGYVR